MLNTRSEPRVAVSVIMAAHNTEPYIGAAIESALSQTHADLELLVVDDASTDNTSGIVDTWAERDRRVRLIRARCGSAAAARNLAIAEARGEYVALLDSDDVWFPAFLERQLAVLASNPGPAIASANALNLGGESDGRPLDQSRTLRRLGFDDVLADETAVCIMAVVPRRVLETLGTFDETLRAEDYEFWLRATFAGFSILKNPEPLGLYRRRANSKSADSRAAIQGIVSVLERVKTWDIAPASRAIIERQLARFERERLAVDAKDALSRGDYASAVALLDDWARADGGLKVTLAALAARHFPAPLKWLVNLRTGRSSAVAMRG